MKDELTYSFKNLAEAQNRLEEGINQVKDQLDCDGVIQRFEFTFELLWKTLKLYLENEGIITKSPKEVLKETFKYGMIENDNLFLDMLEDRNLTSHLYNEDISRGIFNRIKNNYSVEIKMLVKKLSERIE